MTVVQLAEARLNAEGMIGHNNPPSDGEILQEAIRNRHAELLGRIDDLIQAGERIPTEFVDDEMALKAGTYIKQVTAAAKALEASRVGEKEPYLTLSRAVDGFFKSAADRLEGVRRKANAALTDFQRKKEAAERRRREEEAAALRAKQAEEERIALEQEQARQREAADAMIDQAAITEVKAVVAEKAAEAKAADLSRMRTTDGAVMSLRTEWRGEIVDRNALDLEALRPFIPADALQKALNGFIRAGNRELRGARIFEHTETIVR